MVGSMRTAERTSRASSDRIGALDALRGFALCGIIFVNIPQTFGMYAAVGELPEGLRWLVLGKFYPIFCLLFGIGFGIFLRSARARVSRPRVALTRRLVALGVLGALHHLLQPGEVLLPFAVTGLVLLLPASYLGGRALVGLGIGLTVVGMLSGVGGFGVLPGLLVLGVGLAELDVPGRLVRSPAVELRVLVIAVAVAAGALSVILYAVPAGALAVGFGVCFQVATAVGYAMLFLLLLHTPLGVPVSAVLAPMGRMALTNYLTATVLFVPVGGSMGLSGSTNWTGMALLGTGILLVQAVWSRLWLRWFRYGPLEWAWRCVTYARRMPLRTAPSPIGTAASHP